jgi:hypothetical protein
LAAGPPQKVIDWPYGDFYDVSLDASRFLVVKNGADPGGAARSRLLARANWLAGLKPLADR